MLSIRPPKLFLFDIDLTLIDTDGAGSRALALAFEELYGIPNAFAGIPFPGRTDSSIVAEAFARHGIDHAHQPQVMARFKEVYFQFLEGTLADSPRGRVLPGVERLLRLLSQQPEVGLGLATGNFRRAALMKVEHYSLAAYFSDGGFGDDSADRNELVAIAIGRLEARGGISYRRQDIYVVGDTPHDIVSGQANGLATIAVATGHSSPQELATYHPTHLFADLADADAFLRAVL